ncbi:MAG: hypothetical protein HKN25_10105 [Pyrinomonadaceae bacterium]|nr:hypothetical protein [Pyrinomonadaceae bacterium]
MKSFFIFSFLIIFGINTIDGQVRGRPDSTPKTPLQSAMERSDDLNRRSKVLNNVEKFPVKTENERRVFLKAIKPLYRKLTKEEIALLAPADEDKANAEAFLKQKNTGLVRLVSDKGCARNTRVVEASIDCSRYSMPGAGSAYSFRAERHRIHRLADLNFKRNTFQALGTLTHGIMVNLGDVPLDRIDLSSPGMKYITKLKPARNMAAAGDLATKLTKGIKKDGHTYASILAVKPGNTYVLRSIAYRGVLPVTVGGISYNEIDESLDFDKRRDVIIAFRTVRFATNEYVTILWKELRNKKAPKLK